MDEGRVAGCHAADLNGSRARVVHTVVEDVVAKEFAAVLEDAFVGEEGEGVCCCDGGESCG